MQDYWQNYVNGKWIDGGAGKLEVINPGTGERYGDIAMANAADIDSAVKSSSRLSPERRSDSDASRRTRQACARHG